MEYGALNCEIIHEYISHFFQIKEIYHLNQTRLKFEKYPRKISLIYSIILKKNLILKYHLIGKFKA
jgi:hypothetical protein